MSAGLTLPVPESEEHARQLYTVLDMVYQTMLQSEAHVDQAADDHYTAFTLQMQAKVGVAYLNLNEPYLEGVRAQFQLQYLQQLERLATTLTAQVSRKSCFVDLAGAAFEGDGWEMKALNPDIALEPQLVFRLEGETRNFTRRFKQHLDGRRQQAFGIHKYIWRSQDDGRVRHSHAGLDDRVFEWQNPPATGHPGEDYGCRCWAEPTLEGAGEPRVELAALSDDEVAAAVGMDMPTEEELQAEYARLREIDPPAEELYPELWLIPILKLLGAAARIFSRTEEKRENLVKQLASEEEGVLLESETEGGERFAQALEKLSSEGRENIGKLRKWAEESNYKKKENNGGPEVWGVYDNEGNFSWRLKIKPESSNREGLGKGSAKPRFDARVGEGRYYNPLTGEHGGRAIGTHIDLE